MSSAEIGPLLVVIGFGCVLAFLVLAIVRDDRARTARAVEVAALRRSYTGKRVIGRLVVRLVQERQINLRWWEVRQSHLFTGRVLNSTDKAVRIELDPPYPVYDCVQITDGKIWAEYFCTNKGTIPSVIIDDVLE